MSTETTQQVLDGAVEASGLSISTATKTAANNRLGSIYRKDILAAAQPVWFHPLQDGRYIGLLSKRWSAATTVSDGDPNTYSDYTETTLPYWTIINPVTGSISEASTVPSNLSGTLTLIAATSRVDYLFLLGTAAGVAYISHHRVDNLGQLLLQAEELIPILTVVNEEGVVMFDVVFDAGLYIDGDFLYLFGTDDDGNLYRARKHWGRIGFNRDVARQWSYQGARGWHVSANSPDIITPLGTIDATGAVVTRTAITDREYLAVTTDTSTTFYVSRYVETAWKPHSAPITSGNLYLQPQLRYRAEALPEGAQRAVPWVSTEHDATVDAEQLIVEWGLLPI